MEVKKQQQHNDKEYSNSPINFFTKNLNLPTKMHFNAITSDETATNNAQSDICNETGSANVESNVEMYNEMSELFRSAVDELDVSDMVGRKTATTLEQDDKKSAHLRRNIREVMDENQLDSITLTAQREESERLARVAEQLKIVREHKRQTAAINRQLVLSQNRFVLQQNSDKRISSKLNLKGLATDIDIGTDSSSPIEEISVDSQNDVYKNDETLHTMQPEVVEEPAEVVTIEDSSSEDDCILLSDDEEEDLQKDGEEEDANNCGLHVKDGDNVPDEFGRVIVNIGHPEGENDIFIAPQIAKIIKPHQIGGVRFLYDNIIESIKRFDNSSGFGCILSHSMGLGKTLQLVCFCDIFLRYTHSRTVLCVMPINTLQNWVSEFNIWLPKYSENVEQVRPREFDVFVLNDQQKTLSSRAKVILKWSTEGGVLLIGYELFRLLALKILPTRKRRSKTLLSEDFSAEANKRLLERVHQALIKPGPDLVVCDEGHRIKNSHAGISLALKQIRTRRRIVLTGYPLQNNLLEYWCMVDFVRPNYLGTRSEFCNMFERPIQNGQCIDSTPEDIKLMRYRAHVLHSLLLGFVQRRSHVVLQETLPQKLEYVILTRMTSFQRQLYSSFMNEITSSGTSPNPLKAFAVCCKIWNHPDVLYDYLKSKEMDLEIEAEEADIVGDLDPSLATKYTSKNNPIEHKNDGELQLNPSYQLATDEANQVVKYHSHANVFAAESSRKSNNAPESTHFSGHIQPFNCSSDPVNRNVNNNDWQDTTFTYLACQSMLSNVEPSSKPSYVGVMVKDKEDYLKCQSGSAAKSSQIVDLDTKEIKTIETDIDITRNPIVQTDTTYYGQVPSSENVTNQEKKGLKSESPQQNEPLKKSFEIEKDPPKDKGDDGFLYKWAFEPMKKYQPGLIVNSPKMEICFCILNESVKQGDRVLLFSQSLLTLNLIEKFLQKSCMPESNACWMRGVSYFRLDGSTSAQERERLVNEFNTNENLKLFLISTRAGSLGINLVGANRVIVFDASWNPCHDTQAVYRIYRYGQRKPCYVYRIVMDKCLEKKIYDRQIKKQGMSDRVVDECNPDAHLSIRDITNLYHEYDDENDNESKEFSQPLDAYLDSVIREVVKNNKKNLSKEPFYHESLLVDRKEKKLSREEKRLAHRGYEMEKKAAVKNTFIVMNKTPYRINRCDGSIINRPVASIRPMQSFKYQNTTRNSSSRSTRWIPAEVWQRQGMTAQEMILPLDVVIPTQSNDKTNIILKSGQRVMILKSSKGIYMQLESGKIIAIRTSNTVNIVNKSNKEEEVIDITSECDDTTLNTKTSNDPCDGTSENSEKDKQSDSFERQKEYSPKTASNQKKVESILPIEQNASNHTDIVREKILSVPENVQKKDIKANTLLSQNTNSTSTMSFTGENDNKKRKFGLSSLPIKNTTQKDIEAGLVKDKKMALYSEEDRTDTSNLSSANSTETKNFNAIKVQTSYSTHSQSAPMNSKAVVSTQESNYYFNPELDPLKYYSQKGESYLVKQSSGFMQNSNDNASNPSMTQTKISSMSGDTTSSYKRTFLNNERESTETIRHPMFQENNSTFQSTPHIQYPVSYNLDPSNSTTTTMEYNLPTDAHSSTREPNYLCNNSVNDASSYCSYPTQYADVPTYNSYNRHYLPWLHSSSYCNASTPHMDSNPYHLRWPQLSASSNYGENNARTFPYVSSIQPNQWHNI